MGELGLAERRVALLSIKRGEQEIEDLPNDFVLMEQDMVIVRGRPRRVERFEGYINQGET